jgi:hypothetical protein
MIGIENLEKIERNAEIVATSAATSAYFRLLQAERRRHFMLKIHG